MLTSHTTIRSKHHDRNGLVDLALVVIDSPSSVLVSARGAQVFLKLPPMGGEADDDSTRAVYQTARGVEVGEQDDLRVNFELEVLGRRDVLELVGGVVEHGKAWRQKTTHERLHL